MSAVPALVEAMVAVLALVGAVAALAGSFGLASLPTFFQRVHAPTLGSTLGAWALAVATALELSFLRREVFVHALLVPVFSAITAPVTTIFLMRAGLFRRRVAGDPQAPASVG